MTNLERIKAENARREEIKNNRNFVGYEYNEDFDKLISHRAKNEEVEENSIKYMYKNNKKEFNNNLPVMRNKK